MQRIMPISASASPSLQSRIVRPPAHERVRAGLLGAASVWLWVFLSDWLSGASLRTATFLGRAVLSHIAPGAPVWQSVIAFTVVHGALWTGIAALILLFVHMAARIPAVLMFVAVVFILLQLAMVALATALSLGPLGTLAWRSVFVGNAVGWTVTWWYIFRWHPELRAELAKADDE
jgi:hypothetical protein